MPTTFDRALRHVLAWEGLYVRDRDDPGGETKYGISKRAYPELDIKNLTREEAAAIYRRDYWDRIKGEELPPALAFAMFDCAVNQGTGTAIGILQKSLKVELDHKLGPATLAAAHKNPDRTLAEFMAERMFRYAISAGRVRYGRGWFRRLSHIYRISLKGD